jgi:hypothetical protein
MAVSLLFGPCSAAKRETTLVHPASPANQSYHARSPSEFHNLPLTQIIVPIDGPARVAHEGRTIGFSRIPLTEFQNEQWDFYVAHDDVRAAHHGFRDWALPALR